MMLRYRFSTRAALATLVAAVLLTVAIYYAAVELPVSRRLSEIQSERETLQARMDGLSEIAEECERMRSETEAAKASGTPEIPDYDNLPAIMLRLSEIFSDRQPELSAQSVHEDGGMGLRTLTFRFEAESFEDALVLLGGLGSTGFRSDFENLTLTSESSVQDGKIKVSGSMLFYELMP